MNTVLITGSSGLIGSQAVEFYAAQGFRVIGIDNDLRRYFFGAEASTDWNRRRLAEEYPAYAHEDIDIRDLGQVEELFKEYSRDLKLIIHAAAQPSHDWAAREPLTDFSVNANGTLNLLELTRRHCPAAVFILLSTNKVYGDRPNELPLREMPTRWDLPDGHPAHEGINEGLSIDASLHSLYGVSKAAADLLTQEYGRFFGLKTACFRAGCLTGPNHSGSSLHGFLSYLMQCCASATPYTIYGFQGKQLRDNIHSRDLLQAFDCFFHDPRPASVYNIGGGRANSCSVLEAVDLCQEISGQKMKLTYNDSPRRGDHKWYVSDTRKFKADYPAWRITHDLRQMLREIFARNRERWAKVKV